MRGLVAVLLACGVALGGETYVLSAGVEGYDDQRISPLKFAVADARGVAAAFRASGVPGRNVELLTSDQKDVRRRPSRVNLLARLEDIRDRAGADDKVVFFFAGHGVEEAGEQYLLTVDTRRSLLAATALPMSLINAALDGIQAGEVLFLIDACRNDPQAGRSDVDSSLTEGQARGLRPRLVTRPGAAKPRLVATMLSCDVGQRSWEDPDQGHGVFTLFLLRGLSGQAAGDDGAVKLSGLADYVSREVTAWSDKSGRPQSPRVLNPDGGDMVVLIPPPEPLVSVSFANHSLAQAVELLAEQYGVQVVLGRGVDGDLKLTGRLENQPLSSALKVLLTAYDLEVRREGIVYVIEGHTQAPAAPTVKPDTPDLLPPPTEPMKVVWRRKLHERMAFSLSWSTDGRTLASAGQEGHVSFVTIGTWRERGWLEGGVLDACYSASGKYLALARYQEVKLVNPRTGAILMVLRGPDDWISCVAISPDDRLVVGGRPTADTDELWIWSTEDGQAVRKLSFAQAARPAVSAFRARFSPRGDRLYIRGMMRDKQAIITVPGGEVRPPFADESDACWLPDGAGLVQAQPFELRILDELSFEPGRSWRNNCVSGFWSVAVSPDGRYVATGTRTGEVALWLLATGQRVADCPMGASPVWALSFSPDGSLLAAGLQDGDVAVIQLALARLAAAREQP